MSTKRPLRIAGLTPLTTVDFPGRIAAVVWLRGCALRCRYCHNADLQNPACGARDIPWENVLHFFKRRRGLLEGAVLSGGEPLLQSNLPEAASALRHLGFQIALHTAGPSPERLARILPLLDWVGFDVKAPFDSYGPVTGFPKSGEKALESLNLLKASGVPFEVRTTIDEDLTEPAILDQMAMELRDMRITRWVLQEASGTRLPPDLRARFEPFFDALDIRGSSASFPDTSVLLSESPHYSGEAVRVA